MHPDPPLPATELLTRATSLLDLSDALAAAIERNYAEAARLHDGLAGDGAEPFAAVRALGQLGGLLAHATHLAEAQGRELEVVMVELGTRSRGRERS
ncbi:MAG: hypothetical protein H6741_25920 [Alphaproteobacteria bacterium]|nr:hypothetical protein [Alphaproteobacteria bacterium]